MLIRLDPEILHGGVAHVLLPDAPAGSVPVFAIATVPSV